MYIDSIQLAKQNEVLRTVREDHLINQEPYRIFDTQYNCLLDPYHPANEGRNIKEIDDRAVFEILQGTVASLGTDGAIRSRFWDDRGLRTEKTGI